MPSRREIGSTEARELVGIVAQRLEADGKGAAVAVVDPHGELLAFSRTEGCPLPSIKIAIQKAFTAARERSESRALGDKARAEDFPLTNFGEIGYVGWGGGVPLVADGAVIGAIGISGLPETDDMELARWAAGSIERMGD
jgi:glc operon protein GlcG